MFIFYVLLLLLASRSISSLFSIFRQSPPIKPPPLLILPGFGNDKIDYINPLNKGEIYGFVNNLKELGVERVEVVNVKRSDWLKLLGAVGNVDFWRNECKPKDLFRFYFEAVEDSLRECSLKYGEPVVLVGHSAGGWLARALLADGRAPLPGARRKSTSGVDADTVDGPLSDYVIGLVSLGTPHFPPVDPRADMTRGSLRYVDENFPGAYLRDTSDIFYLTVAGTAVFGDPSAPKGSTALFASKSYLQVTGDAGGMGMEVGDGVVPLSFSHLEGAEQVTLSGVWHSIQAPGNCWYGGRDVIPLWLPLTLKASESTRKIREKPFLRRGSFTLQ